METAPIALFLYNRVDHATKTLDALAHNDLASASTLHVFLDGPKNGDFSVQAELEILCKSFSEKFSEIHIYKKEANAGLARSIIDGVSKIFQNSDRIIVVEDDLVTSRKFLSFMNNTLEKYASSANIYSVNAYMHPVNFIENEVFLSKLGTSSWGWGTWKEKWKSFEENIEFKSVLQNNRQMRIRFNIADLDYSAMLDNKTSWAIKWYYSVFIRGGLGVFPTKSFVRNIGFDGSGENCNDQLDQQTVLNQMVPTLPELEKVDIEKEAQLFSFFERKRRDQNIVTKIKTYIKKTF